MANEMCNLGTVKQLLWDWLCSTQMAMARAHIWPASADQWSYGDWNAFYMQYTHPGSICSIHWLRLKHLHLSCTGNRDAPLLQCQLYQLSVWNSASLNALLSHYRTTEMQKLEFLFATKEAIREKYKRLFVELAKYGKLIWKRRARLRWYVGWGWHELPVDTDGWERRAPFARQARGKGGSDGNSLG